MQNGAGISSCKITVKSVICTCDESLFPLMLQLMLRHVKYFSSPYIYKSEHKMWSLLPINVSMLHLMVRFSYLVMQKNLGKPYISHTRAPGFVFNVMYYLPYDNIISLGAPISQW